MACFLEHKTVYNYYETRRKSSRNGIQPIVVDSQCAMYVFAMHFLTSLPSFWGFQRKIFSLSIDKMSCFKISSVLVRTLIFKSPIVPLWVTQSPFKFPSSSSVTACQKGANTPVTWENVRPSTLGLSELGCPKMPSHFFPIATLGVDQLPILQNSKSETPDLSDLCLDHETEVDFLFFLLVAEFRAQKS